MPNLNHFRDVLRAFIKSHEIRTQQNFNNKHNPLRPNTISLRAFNDGTRQDLVRQTLNDFGNYFNKIKDGKYYGYTPIYHLIAKDYPELFPPHLKIPILRKSNREQIVEAINDEIEATSNFARQNPIFANVIEKLEWGIKGKFYYRMILKNERETELNLSDNIPVRISWTASDENLLEGTMVLFDPLNETIVLELNRKLNNYEIEHTCRILPGTIDLLIALQNRISLIDERHIYSNQLINGKLEFKRLKHFNLTNSSALDTSQARAVEQAISNNITYIWGPPGTGKTHTLARLIRELLNEGERILVASISNVAIDQLAAKVLNELNFNNANKISLLESGKLLRYGYPVLEQVKMESRLFPQKLELSELLDKLNSLRQQIEKTSSTEKRAELKIFRNQIQKDIKEITKKFISNARCVFTTSTQCQLEDAFLETEWDTLVVDEASMVSITHLIALAMNAKKRIVVAGDFNQLGPIALAQSKYAKEWLNEDSFVPLNLQNENPEHPNLQMLTTQRRMHVSISNAISKTFYNGKMKSSAELFDEDFNGLIPLPNSPIVWFKHYGIAEQKGSTRINKNNATKVVELAYILSTQTKKLTIGIITPYRGQVSEIKKQLGEWKASDEFDKASLKIGTVHAFQGDESDVIIFDTVDTRELAVGKLYHGQNGNRLVNVAISRAKKKLIFLGDLNLFIDGNGSNNTGRFAKLLQDYIIHKGSTHFIEHSESEDSFIYQNILRTFGRAFEN
jgi:superfamily I DNA and/or RNA helicase